MIKNIFFIGVAFVLSGCMTNYYVLSVPTQPDVIYKSKKGSIGVEKVAIPEYLFKREVIRAVSISQIEFISGANWAEDLDGGLTRRVIGFIQNKFRQPNVSAYPWETDRNPDFKIRIGITRFMAQGDKVYLDANWNITKLNSRKVSQKLFSTTVKTKSSATEIVSAMNKAFTKLEDSLANDLKKF